MYVSAFDEKTRAPITGLGVRDFVVREDGAAREVLRVTPATSPMAVAILVDNTQAATNNIADIRRALQSFIKALDGVGPVSIIGVADRPTILRDYTTDQKQLLDGANRVFAMPDSGATLLDAVVRNQPRPAEARGRSRRDGDRHDREHRVQPASLPGSARSARPRRRAAARGDHDHAGRQRARTIRRAIARTCSTWGPKASGGTRTDILTSQAFEGKLQELAAILKSQHRLVYARPQTLIPPEKIEVSAAKPGIVATGGPARGQALR